jgi:hypothetical protein
VSTALRRGRWLPLAALAADVLRVLVGGPSSGVGAGGLALRLLLLALLLVVLPVRRRALWLLLLPALLHFHTVSGRLSGDGASYYAQLRSLARDGDIDLANEYQALGLLDRPELRVPTRTGLRRTVFSVGPALLGLPFFAVGDAVARLQGLQGRPADLSGYGPCHVNAVALGGLLFGFAAVWIVESTLRRHFAARTARLAALLTWGATFLYWYMVQQGAMSHTQSAFLAAAFLWQWDRSRPPARLRDAVALGLLGALALCVRWQNALLLLLPVLDALAAVARARREDRAAQALRLARRLLPLGAAAALGLVPQMLVWHALHGEWWLGAPPQGTDFVRLDRPFLLETLFSSRHGLLSWTPALWAGFLGFVPLLRRRPALAAPLLAPLLALTYVNACSGDWWAGGSFSNRRFDGLLPILAFGLAAAVEWARRALRRRPALAAAVPVLLLAGWNVPLAIARARGTLPADDTVAFDQLVGGVAQTFADGVGSPTTWPASWWFAARHGLSPARFDTLVGRYLFYRQNSQRGCVEPGATAHEPQLAGGWGGREDDGAGGALRVLDGEGRIYVGLDLPQDLVLAVRAAADASTRFSVDVNGRAAGDAGAGPGWTTARLRVPAALWRRDLNVVTLRPQAPLRVRGLRFERDAGEPSAPCGLEGP